jgi:tetratricopeptide (TPR) repeat protein
VKLRPLIQLALLSLLVMLASCNYATKLSDQLLPDAEYKSTIVKAETAMQSAEWAKAADLYEKAGQIKPGDWSLKLKQAEAYQNDGKLAQAFNAYQVIIDAKLPSNEINNEIVKKAKERQAKSGFKAEPAIVNVDPEPAVEAPPEEVAVTEQVSEVAPIQTEVLPSITEAAAVAMETEIVSSGQGASDQVILDTLQSWITAWTSKNLPDYYAHYTKDFTGGVADPGCLGIPT